MAARACSGVSGVRSAGTEADAHGRRTEALGRLTAGSQSQWHRRAVCVCVCVCSRRVCQVPGAEPGGVPV
eukprot:scaffold26319_cov56-Phaeocystis_antarctica.AAC.4